MTSSVYDIQGKPIKKGYLVAFAYHGALLRERVAEEGLARTFVPTVVMESGLYVEASLCVVLEEPVWPNS